MDTTSTRLRVLVKTPSFIDEAHYAFENIRPKGYHNAMQDFGHLLSTCYGVSSITTPHGIMFWLSGTRAKQPACATVSRRSGSGSPSAVYQHFASSHLIQVFEADADDTLDAVGGTGEVTPYRIEAQGRMLFV